jgi:hypothetical protein
MRRPETLLSAVYVLMAALCLKLFYLQQRGDFNSLILLVSLFFVLYLTLVRTASQLKSEKPLKLLIGGAIILRALGLFALPSLSDDLFRFIWDGNLSLQGLNPFLFTPAELTNAGSALELDAYLFEEMNSPDYHTVYPPVLQGIFLFSASISGSSVLLNSMVMKLFTLAVEVGSIIQISYLLKVFGKSPRWVLLYAFNPLIILEFAGNLHFEAIMIFFLLLTWRWLLEEKWLPAFLAFAIAVHTKLIPLVLLPYLFFSLGPKKSFSLLGILLLSSILLWFPFVGGEAGINLFSSLDLYFRSFEFNGSIYYLLRWLGFQIKGYNLIGITGPVLAATSTLIILGISWHYRDKSLKNLGFVLPVSLTVLYLLSTTVHPWYITPLLAFLPFYRWMYPLLWSFLIFLSYQAYSAPAGVEEHTLILLAEYGLLFLFIAYEWKRMQNPAEEQEAVLQGLLKLNAR